MSGASSANLRALSDWGRRGQAVPGLVIRFQNLSLPRASSLLFALSPTPSLLVPSADAVSLSDIMHAGAPYTVIERVMHIHPTVTELIPTMLEGLQPAS